MVSMWQALACEQCIILKLRLQVYCHGTCLYVVSSFLAKSTHTHFLLAGGAWSLLTGASVHSLLAPGFGQSGKGPAYSILVFVWTKWSYLLIQLQLMSIAEHARRNVFSVGRTVTDMSLAPVDSSQTASGTCASVFTRLHNSLLTVALSLVSMLLVALSSLVSTLAVSSCLSELMVSTCKEIISMLW